MAHRIEPGLISPLVLICTWSKFSSRACRRRNGGTKSWDTPLSSKRILWRVVTKRWKPILLIWEKLSSRHLKISERPAIASSLYPGGIHTNLQVIQELARVIYQRIQTCLPVQTKKRLPPFWMTNINPPSSAWTRRSAPCPIRRAG